jgi:hypothetical protein
MNDNPISYKILTNGQDYEFITSAYVSGRYKEPPYNNVHPTIYYTECNKYIKSILSRSLVALTHLDAEEDTYFSYVIYQYVNGGIVIHYAYTKNGVDGGFRRKGLIKNTLDLIIPEQCEFIIATHYPKSDKVWERFKELYPNAVFDPFYLTRNI